MYKKIMVPLDGSKLAECVLPHVELMVKACNAPEVILVQAFEPITIPVGREASKIKSLDQLMEFEVHGKTEAEKYLKGIASQLAKSGINTKTEIIVGKASEALSDFAAKHAVDLVIIATHGRSGITRWVMGSIADRLIHSIKVPILLIRPT